MTDGAFECPCCTFPTAEGTLGKGWRCRGCGSRGVFVDQGTRPAVTHAAEGTHYFDPELGPLIRADARAGREKAVREREEMLAEQHRWWRRR